MTEPRRPILYSSYYGDLDGGGELRMLDHLRHSSFGTGRFSVLCFQPGPLVGRLESWDIPTTVVPFRWELGPRQSALHYPRLFARVASRLREAKPSLVISNGYLDLPLVGPAAALLGIPILWRARAEWVPNLPPRPGARGRATLWFLRHRVARIATTTAYERNLLVQRGIPPEHVTTVYNGVDVERFDRARPARERIRREWGVPEGTTLLGVVARLSRLKGYEVMLDALRELTKDAAPWRAVFVGENVEEPDYVASLKRRVEEMGLGDRILFAGYREDVPEVLSALDVFVLSSLVEPFGTVVIEAMAAGKPVVSTRTRGPEEMLEEGVTGMFVPPGDAPPMASAIRAMVSDQARARAMGEAARADVARRFSLAAMMAGLDAACLAAAPEARPELEAG
jgi:glycosyltransferase involved in cell wall biosynthesis